MEEHWSYGSALSTVWLSSLRASILSDHSLLLGPRVTFEKPQDLLLSQNNHLSYSISLKVPFVVCFKTIWDVGNGREMAEGFRSPSFPSFRGQPFAVCFLVFIGEIHSSCMHALWHKETNRSYYGWHIVCLHWQVRMLPQNFWQNWRKRNVLYKPDSFRRLGKINGGKTRTGFSVTLRDSAGALRKMLKMMRSEQECHGPAERHGGRNANLKRSLLTSQPPLMAI